MSLFGPNDPNALVTEDDDSGHNRNARIAGNRSAGAYFVTVRHFDPRSTGSYPVVRSAPATIAQVGVDGPAVQGTSPRLTRATSTRSSRPPRTST